jgi:formate dehydrogenase formation protein
MPDAQTVTSPWAANRRRGEGLRDRHPHARQVLTLYLALLDAWEDGWRLARDVDPGGLAGWAADRVAPLVVATTVHSGPEPLAAAVSQLDRIEPLLAGWLAGAEQPPVERYLARAVLRGPLAAVDAGAACAQDPAPRGGRHCPSCGGLPQLSYRTGDSDVAKPTASLASPERSDGLVSGRRLLACCRCPATWGYASNACAWCGETAGARRTVFAEHRDRPVVGRGGGADPDGEPPLFPHLRIEACESCERYLIDVDLGLDARAVPEVDELAALPLDLFAAEHGLRKVAPNLMGF